MSFGDLSEATGLTRLWGASGPLTPKKTLTRAAQSPLRTFTEGRFLQNRGVSRGPLWRHRPPLPLSRGLCPCFRHCRPWEGRGSVARVCGDGHLPATSQEDREGKRSPATCSPPPRRRVHGLRVRLTVTAPHTDDDGNVTGKTATRSSWRPGPRPEVAARAARRGPRCPCMPPSAGPP